MKGVTPMDKDTYQRISNQFSQYEKGIRHQKELDDIESVNTLINHLIYTQPMSNIDPFNHK